MEELTVYQSNLPANIEDLARFALIGREKMVAVRAEIRAIDKLGLAEEVRRQKLEEGQMISEAVLDAEVRIGTLLKDVPEQITGRPKRESKDSSIPTFKTPKQEARDSIGISRKQADRFVQLAKHPEIVEQAKAEALRRLFQFQRKAVALCPKK